MCGRKDSRKEPSSPSCFPDVGAVENLKKKSRRILFNGRSRAPILPYPAPDSHMGTSRQSGGASLDAGAELFHNAHFSEADRRSMQEIVTVPRKTPCYRRRWLGYCHHPTTLCPGWKPRMLTVCQSYKLPLASDMCRLLTTHS